MDALLQGGTDAPAGTSPAAAAASSNSSSAAESLPLSVPTTATTDGDGGKADAEKKARGIFQKLAKQNAGEDEDGGDGDDVDELDGDGGDGEGIDAGKADADETAAGKGAAKPSDAPKPEALDEAREALVRDSWTLADLAKLPPERVLELGAKARQRQQAQDRFGSSKAQEVAALKAKLAELEGTPANNPQQGQQQQQAAPNKSAIDAANDPFLKGLKEQMSKLGELASPEAQAVIEQALTSVYAASNAQAQQRVATLQQQFATIQAATERQLLTAARKSLGKEFPDLKDDTKWGEVQTKAKAFAKSGLYGPGDMEKLIRDVSATMFQPGIKDVQRQMVERSKRAKNGQVDVGQQAAPKPERPLTGEEKSKAILKQLQAGKSPDAARRKVLAGSR